MKVTNVFVKPSTAGGSSRGYGNVEFDGQVSINFTIYRNKEGSNFVSWPKYKKADGSYGSQVFFKDEAFRDSVSQQVLDKLATGGTAESTVADPPGFDSNDEVPF